MALKEYSMAGLDVKQDGFTATISPGRAPDVFEHLFTAVRVLFYSKQIVEWDGVLGRISSLAFSAKASAFTVTFQESRA